MTGGTAGVLSGVVVPVGGAVVGVGSGCAVRVEPGGWEPFDPASRVVLHGPAVVGQPLVVTADRRGEGLVTAEPLPVQPDPDDPAEILAVLPNRWHVQFLAEYRSGPEAAREVGQWPQLRALSTTTLPTTRSWNGSSGSSTPH